MSKNTAATRDEVKAVLIGVLAEIQDLGGEEVPEIDGETCPMKDLADLTAWAPSRR